MRETQASNGAHTHTHTQQREREREGGLTLIHRGHFGDIPCREVSVELCALKH